jgi:uncharacterized membrane protein YfcA
MDFLFYIIAGAGVGLAVGITGVGGGSLMTPLLIFAGIPHQVAIGTDLLYAAITKAGGVVAHRRQGTVRWRLVLLLAAGSLPAAIATAYVLKAVFNGDHDYRPILTHALGFMLILTALVLLLKRRLQGESTENPLEIKWYHRHASIITVIAGIVLGVLVTLSSVGAGAFGAALLLTLYPRLPALHVVGTDIAHAVPLTLIAGLGHLILLNNVDFQLLVGLLLGSLPAVHYGAKVASRIPNAVLQPVLAVLLLVIGVKFAFF